MTDDHARGSPPRLLPRQFLFIVVIVLFGGMNVGAAIAFALDMQERRNTLRRLQEPAAGFAVLPGDVWTWTCTQLPMLRAVEAPRGSAVTLAGIFGLPLVRLRCALPELLFCDTPSACSVGQALGRREGLSVQGLADAAQENLRVMQQLANSLPCCGGGRAEQIPAFADVAHEQEERPAGALLEVCVGHSDSDTHYSSCAADISATCTQPPALVSQPSSSAGLLVRSVSAGACGADADEALADGEPTLSPDANKLLGTALVFAFMANAKTVPVAELARRQKAASGHFAGVRVPGIAFGFDALLSMFLVMLSPGNLSSRGDWLEKARLWRLIMLQQQDGGWRVSESLAFAVEAHAGSPPPPRDAPSKCATVLGLLAGGELDEALEEALTSSSDDDEEDAAVLREQRGAATLMGRIDCPLTFSATAIRQRMPKALLRLNLRFSRQQSRLQAAPSAAAAAATPRHAAEEASLVAAQHEKQLVTAAAADAGTDGTLEQVAASALEAPQQEETRPLAEEQLVAAAPAAPATNAAATAAAASSGGVRKPQGGMVNHAARGGHGARGARGRPAAARGASNSNGRRREGRSNDASVAQTAATAMEAPSEEDAPSVADEQKQFTAAITASADDEPPLKQASAVVATGPLSLASSGASSLQQRCTEELQPSSEPASNSNMLRSTPSSHDAAAVVAAWPPDDASAAADTADTRAAARTSSRLLHGRVPIERIWCTVLCLKILEEQDECWLADEDAEPEETIVDRGRIFLEAQAEANEGVKKLLAAGTLQNAAERARKDWHAIQEHNISALRDAEVLSRFTALTHMQRASARVVRSMMTDHECVRACVRAYVHVSVVEPSTHAHAGAPASLLPEACLGGPSFNAAEPSPPSWIATATSCAGSAS
jgi:hypothetical protein